MPRWFHAILGHLGYSKTLTINVYRKPTLTDQYLHCDSHHYISVKYSVINTLHHRAKAVNYKPELLITEEELVREVLTKYKYPAWGFDRMEYKNYQQNKPNNKANNSTKKCKGYIIIPYMQGLCGKH